LQLQLQLPLTLIRQVQGAALPNTPHRSECPLWS